MTSVRAVRRRATRQRALAVVRAAFAAGDVDLVLPAFGVLGDQDRFEAEPDRGGRAGHGEPHRADGGGLLEAARLLRAQGHGTLVLFSSIAGVRGRRANYVYGSTKAALDALGTGWIGAARLGRSGPAWSGPGSSSAG